MATAKNISDETKNEAMKVAKATQKPGQNKEQTKLIAAGIEKGIAEYKKQNKSKARDRDKARKQDIKSKIRASATSDTEVTEVEDKPKVQLLPWGLLVISWIGFVAFYLVG
ncbi:DUF2956 domain-containing protein [Shewanella sp. D64]|uniref:DUF2956 domain-containing protein n=1 Tax=unclassified Shewanella TaxID=196818 RepID=UPI0022BA296C|nr:MULTISPECIES: DUF2956 domain-containing protein [unclassified Shewanella]MEC4724991.1 DUF2956 domain-containing protein [Shewanella sp. D64]MEC4736892.1 DUF2956 domain-containing protein [Shewanella sp. E94]WBJ96489.1 DUF2956 domain-containing protein [Shewanella sp. MTB7]